MGGEQEAIEWRKGQNNKDMRLVKFKIKASADFVSAAGPIPGAQTTFWLDPHMTQSELGLLPLCIRALILHRDST